MEEQKEKLNIYQKIQKVKKRNIKQKIEKDRRK